MENQWLPASFLYYWSSITLATKLIKNENFFMTQEVEKKKHVIQYNDLINST